MKRLLHLLLAATLSTGAPVATVAEDVDVIDDPAGADDPSGPRRHTGLRAAASIVVEREPTGVARIGALSTAADTDALYAATILLRAALAECRTSGDMKLVVDLPLDLDALVAECRRHGFNYAGGRARSGPESHDFFLDLYSKVAPPPACERS
jgi:hypothetical protein